MRKLFTIILILFSSLNILKAQEKDFVSETTRLLNTYHDSLQLYENALISGQTEALRSAASYKMIKILSKALRLENSFSYDFDSLKSIAVLTPEDHQFRIFTWQLAFDNGTYRYFGVIQSNNPIPKLQPLVDYSDFYENPQQVIVDANRWIGTLYYKIIPVKKENTTYYTLLGWDGNNTITNKKIIDILWFDEAGSAKFGYPLFKTGKKNTITRFVLEYKKDAVASLTYYPKIQQIFFDHLTSLSGNKDPDAYDKVPDGTLEAFEWKKGMWQHIETVDYQKREDGEAPNVIKDKQKPQLYQPLPKR